MSRQKTQGKILVQAEISPRIYSMWIEVQEIAKEARAGQFVSLFTGDGSKLLPRPISICEIDREAGKIRLVYRVTGAQTGTALLSEKQAGQYVEVMGPLGNGFPLGKGRRPLLLGGGIGIPPMLQLAKDLKKAASEKEEGQKETEAVTVAAGYRDCLFLTEELSACSDLYVATEDGSAGSRGTILDAIEEKELEGDVIYACGPTPMLKAVQAYAKEKGILCYLSLEERMACGIGACLACVCRSREVDAHSRVNNKRVCKEGPVFEASEVEWL